MSIDRLERRLPEVLTELSLPVMPDYVDSLLSRTERMPQRPGWSFPERWFPMSTITATLSARRPASLRPLIVLAIVAALVAGALLIYVGSQNRLPPLYGPAKNGLVVTDRNGEIVTIDPETGASSVLVSGDHLCCASVANDGRHVSYLDIPFGGDEPASMEVATIEGQSVAQIPREFVFGLEWSEWSAKGDRIVLAVPQSIAVFDLATVQTTKLAISVPSQIVRASWIGASSDLLISARRPPSFGGESVPLHVYRYSASTGAVAEIATLQDAVEPPLLAPDGSKFAYFTWGTEPRLQGRVHVYDLGTNIDTAVTPDDEASNADPHSVEGIWWSPDSASIGSYWLWTSYDQLGVIPATGGQPVFIGPREPKGFGQGGVARFSPDGKSVLLKYGNQDTILLVPVSGAESRQVSWALGPELDWQRLAP